MELITEGLHIGKRRLRLWRKKSSRWFQKWFRMSGKVNTGCNFVKFLANHCSEAGKIANIDLQRFTNRKLPIAFVWNSRLEPHVKQKCPIAGVFGLVCRFKIAPEQSFAFSFVLNREAELVCHERSATVSINWSIDLQRFSFYQTSQKFLTVENHFQFPGWNKSSGWWQFNQ